MTVYVVQSDCGRIKVGYTEAATADDRLRSLQTGSPRKLTCLLTFPGDVAMEQRIHRVLTHDRLHGEWFKPSPRLASLFRFVAEFGNAHGWTEAEQHPEEWAAYATKYGQAADLEPLYQELGIVSAWKRSLDAMARNADPMNEHSISREWRSAIWPGDPSIAHQHLHSEWVGAPRVEWVHGDRVLKGTGLHATVDLLDRMPEDGHCWPWLGAFVHEVTRGQHEIRTQFPQFSEFAAIVRRKTNGWWHHLSPALPCSISLPKRCRVTFEEFVGACAKQARLIAADSRAEFHWPENATGSVSRREVAA